MQGFTDAPVASQIWFFHLGHEDTQCTVSFYFMGSCREPLAYCRGIGIFVIKLYSSLFLRLFHPTVSRGPRVEKLTMGLVQEEDSGLWQVLSQDFL